MKKFLLRLYRRTILRSVRFWQSRWGEKSLLVVLAIGIGAVAAVAAALLHTLVTRLEQFGIWLTQKPKELHEFAWLAVLLVAPAGRTGRLVSGAALLRRTALCEKPESADSRTEPQTDQHPRESK